MDGGRKRGGRWCSAAGFPVTREFLTRLLTVLSAAAVVVGIARFRPQQRGWILRVEGNLSGPGAFLFTAAACDSCHSARSALRRILGEDGFTEFTWEEHPDLLTRLGVAEVPSGSVLDASGREVGFFLGVPGRFRLRRAVRKAGLRAGLGRTPR